MTEYINLKFRYFKQSYFRFKNCFNFNFYSVQVIKTRLSFSSIIVLIKAFNFACIQLTRKIVFVLV